MGPEVARYRNDNHVESQNHAVELGVHWIVVDLSVMEVNRVVGLIAAADDKYGGQDDCCQVMVFHNIFLSVVLLRSVL